MIKNIKYLLLCSLFAVACSSDDDNNGGEEPQVPVTAGSANFSKFVSVGNSLTAGFSDNALFRSGQEYSYPNILAQQFALAGGGEFTTPYMNDNLGGLLLGGNVIQGTRLYFNGTGPANVPGTPTTEVTSPLGGMYNNMGVPGAKSFHLVAPGYGNPAGVATGAANPYYARFASSTTSTILGDAVQQNATFFSLWIGNNDVLSYATSGGAGVNQTGNLDPTTYGPNDITDPNVFGSVYSSLLDGLTANGAKGVVANIPYVTSIPYFRTVPYNPVPLDAATAAMLMSPAAYGQYNGGLQVALGAGLISADEAARRTINFAAGTSNAVVIVDSYLTNLAALGLPSYRQATAEDLIILPARTFIGTTVGGNPSQINGVSVPLADNWVLSKDEVAEVKTAVDAYNASIQALADAKGLAVVDANALLTELFNNGIPYENYVLKSDYVFGGAFSLDGVHPTSRGYALIANEFIREINEKYGSTLPTVKLTNYPMLRPVTID